MRKSVWALCFMAFVLATSMGCGGGGGGGGGTSAYSQADLSGDWGCHVLGANPTGSVWGHGIYSIDASGKGVVTTETWSDSSHFDNNITLTLSGGGVMSEGVTSLHGFMSVDKNTVVATYSNGAGGNSLWLLQRVGTTTFSQADLSGDWGFHVLGGTPTGFGSSWGHGIYSIDNTGKGVVTTQTWSDNTPQLDNTTFTLSIAGVMGSGVDNTQHGFMSIDKNTVVATFTNDAGGSSFWILQRRVGTTFLPADLTGTWGCHLLGLTPTQSAWGYGEYSIDNTGKGVVVITPPQASSDFTLVFFPTTFALSNAGEMSTIGDDHGFMSVDKNTMVATFTNFGGGSSFWLLQKR